MHAEFTDLQGWSDAPRLDFDALLHKFPSLQQQLAPLDHAAHADLQGLRFILLTGNISITQAQLTALNQESSSCIVVDGHVRIEGRASGIFYVSGDLHCDSIELSGQWPDPCTGGRIIAGCAQLCAEDDCHMRPAPRVRLDARFLFSWFHRIDNIDLGADTVVVILGDWDYCSNLALPNPVFAWHECAHVLDARFQSWVDSDNYDGASWDYAAIESALRRGESVYKDGYDIACHKLKTAADDALTLGDAKLAYLLYRQAAAISPAYDQAWLGMGDALYGARAFEQALAAYIKAGSLFPKNQTGMVNRALNTAACCALRCQQWALAAALATESIMHNDERDEPGSDLAPPYRFRAEALMQMGRRADALADRARALEIDPDDDADFPTGAATTVDWDRLDPAAAVLPPQDAAYWSEFMRHSEPAKIRKVPPAYRSAALLGQILATGVGERGAQFAASFPPEAFTRENAEILVARSPDNLRYIPPALIDKALCMLAQPGKSGFALARVPERIIDAELCLRAVQCEEKISAIPACFVDHHLCTMAVQAQVYALEDVPAELVDDAMMVTAIAYGHYYYFDNRLPDHFKQARLLEAAISNHQRALDAIPGHRFDRGLFALAQQRYGEHPDWNGIVARHSPPFCRQHPDQDPGQVCWNAFWDEPFMLEQIAKENGYLSPWDIPDGLFTQTIADACFWRHPLHLKSIPRRFITEAMRDQFRWTAPEELVHVPVALRNAEICAAAVAKDARNIHLVPLALRSVDLCVAAIVEDDDLETAVPAAVHRAVFDRLIAEHQDDLNVGWLYLKRGDGALWNGDHAAAIADYQVVLAEPAHPDVEPHHIEEAKYSMGLAYYRRGDLALAAQWRDPGGDWLDYADFSFEAPAEPADCDDQEPDFQARFELGQADAPGSA